MAIAINKGRLMKSSTSWLVPPFFCPGCYFLERVVLGGQEMDFQQNTTKHRVVEGKRDDNSRERDRKRRKWGKEGNGTTTTTTITNCHHRPLFS
jgi:hypothetical protein